jgi:hypothetical protein
LSDKAWKATERMTATLLHGKRVPITGRQRGDVPDVEHPWLSIEVKHRKALPNWLLDAMSQARASAKDGQLPIAVLHEAGQRHANSLVVVRLSEFIEWFGEIYE